MSVAVANYDYEFQTQGQGPGSDHALLMGHATFSHNIACEFIMFARFDDDIYTTIGFSEDFITLIKRAREQGFYYLCVYA